MLTTPPPARLLVLVPNGDLPIIDLAQRIWTLAAEAGSAVLLVGLAEGPEREAQVRRVLALLQSHMRFDPVPVSTRVACVPDWLSAVKQLRRPGDRVVCFPDQEAPAGVWGLGHQPLATALQTQLRVGVFVVADVVLPAPRRANWLHQAMGWGLSLGLIAGFFAVQVWLQSAAPGSAGTLLLTLSVVAEFTLLGAVYQWRLRE